MKAKSSPNENLKLKEPIKSKQMVTPYNQESFPRSNQVIEPPSNAPKPDDIDLPIAPRKLHHSYTFYPISKYVSYNALSTVYHAFTSNLGSVKIPKNIQEELESYKWRDIVIDKMGALKKIKLGR